jgi:hypothetical protein
LAGKDPSAPSGKKNVSMKLTKVSVKDTSRLAAIHDADRDSGRGRAAIHDADRDSGRGRAAIHDADQDSSRARAAIHDADT